MTNCSGMARQRTHITFCNGFRTTVFSAAAGLGADGKSAYELAVEQGFTGTLAEWLESLKADCGDCTGGDPEAPEPVRRLLVPTGATETANDEYQHFESDGTHELLTSFGVSGLTAELDPVDWMAADSHEYRLVIQVPSGLDDLNPDVPAPPFVYMLIADGAVADLFVGSVNAIEVTLSYVVEPEPALGIQLGFSGEFDSSTLDTVYLPYVVGQPITLLYQPLQQRVSVLADTTPVLDVADWPDQFANQHLNMGLLFASFVPDTTVQISAYAETLAVEPDRIGALEGRVDDLEQAMAAVDELFDDLSGRVDEIDALIDTKISQSVQPSGVVDVAIDTKISQSVQPSGVVDVAIDAKLNPAIAAVEDFTWSINPYGRLVDSTEFTISNVINSMGKYFLLNVPYDKPDANGNSFGVGAVLKRTPQGLIRAQTSGSQSYVTYNISGNTRLGVYSFRADQNGVGQWQSIDDSVFLDSTNARSFPVQGITPTIFLSYYSEAPDHVHLDFDSQISRLVLTQRPQRVVTINALESGSLQLFAGQLAFNPSPSVSNWSDIVVSGDLIGLTVANQVATLNMTAGDFWRVTCQVIRPVNSAGAVGGFKFKTLLHFERLTPNAVALLPISQSDVDGLPAALNALSATDVQQQAAIDLKLDASVYNPLWQGRFNSVFELNAMRPPTLMVGGSFAQVDWGVDLVMYIVDTLELMWRPVQGTLATNSDEVTEGSFNLYHTPQRVRDVTLTGLDLSINTPVTTVDKLITALGKLQSQINDAPKTLIASTTPVELLSSATGVSILPSVFDFTPTEDGVYQILIDFYMGVRSSNAILLPYILINDAVLTGADVYASSAASSHSASTFCKIRVELIKAGSNYKINLERNEYRISQGVTSISAAIMSTFNATGNPKIGFAHRQAVSLVTVPSLIVQNVTLIKLQR